MPDQIHSERLIHIFNNDLEQFKTSMEEFKDKTNFKQQKCEILICFWFAIDRTNIPACQYLYDSDNMI